MKFLERWHVECDFRGNGKHGTRRESYPTLNKAEERKQEMLENPYQQDGDKETITCCNPRIRLVIYEDLGVEEKSVRFGKIYLDQELVLRPSY
jgi:hypothetical protein